MGKRYIRKYYAFFEIKFLNIFINISCIITSFVKHLIKNLKSLASEAD